MITSQGVAEITPKIFHQACAIMTRRRKYCGFCFLVLTHVTGIRSGKFYDSSVRIKVAKGGKVKLKE